LASPSKIKPSPPAAPAVRRIFSKISSGASAVPHSLRLWMSATSTNGCVGGPDVKIVTDDGSRPASALGGVFSLMTFVDAGTRSRRPARLLQRASSLSPSERALERIRLSGCDKTTHDHVVFDYIRDRAPDQAAGR
jgi:hypothetical protein